MLERVMDCFAQQDPDGKAKDVGCVLSLNMAAASANAARREKGRISFVDSEMGVGIRVHGSLFMHSYRLGSE